MLVSVDNKVEFNSTPQSLTLVTWLYSLQKPISYQTIKTKLSLAFAACSPYENELSRWERQIQNIRSQSSTMVGT